MLSSFGSTNQDIQNIASRIRRDVEHSLNRGFNRWDLFECEPVVYDPAHTTYHMKMLTDDNGHVKVKTVKKDPSHDWETTVEEYDRGVPINQNSALQGEQNKALQGSQNQNLQGDVAHTSQHHHGHHSLQHHQELFNQEMRDFANSFKRDIESTLNRNFNTWDLGEFGPIPYDLERSWYRMKMLTDDNGHVRMKTMRKDPNQPWITNVEEYDRGDALQGGGQKMAIEQHNQNKTTGRSSQDKGLERGSQNTFGEQSNQSKGFDQAGATSQG